MDKSRAELGRVASRLAEIVRNRILAGHMAGDAFLPSERALAAEYSMDKKTVRRALKSLELEGMIDAVRRHGYRVRPTGKSSEQRLVAFLCARQYDPANWQTPETFLFPALQEAARSRGWSVVALGSSGRTAHGLLNEVKSFGAGGIVLDTGDRALVAAVEQSGTPAVMTDAWREESGLDSIMQDGQWGGMLAARHLCDQGCRRVGWAGPHPDKSVHALDRYSGVAAELLRYGRHLDARLVFVAQDGMTDAQARRWLNGARRPDGVVAFWRHFLVPLARAAGALGLESGRDIRFVGWSPEEHHVRNFVPDFQPGPAPAAIVWPMKAMAEEAIQRLALRQRRPELPPVRVKIPVTLKT